MFLGATVEAKPYLERGFNLEPGQSEIGLSGEHLDYRDHLGEFAGTDLKWAPSFRHGYDEEFTIEWNPSSMGVLYRVPGSSRMESSMGWNLDGLYVDEIEGLRPRFSSAWRFKESLSFAIEMFLEYALFIPYARLEAASLGFVPLIFSGELRVGPVWQLLSFWTFRAMLGAGGLTCFYLDEEADEKGLAKLRKEDRLSRFEFPASLWSEFVLTDFWRLSLDYSFRVNGRPELPHVSAFRSGLTFLW